MDDPNTTLAEIAPVGPTTDAQDAPPPAAKEATVVHYIGKGKFYPGVPTRDLTAAEWREVGAKMRKLLLDQGLYRLAKPTQAKKSSKKAVK